MPYIIKTTTWPRTQTPGGGSYTIQTEREHAVATLEEAREACFDAMATVPRYPLPVAARLGEDIWRLSESGGTIGPLPDGTVVEVRKVTWPQLRQQTLHPEWASLNQPAILAAYNAR